MSFIGSHGFFQTLFENSYSLAVKPDLWFILHICKTFLGSIVFS